MCADSSSFSASSRLKRNGESLKESKQQKYSRKDLLLSDDYLSLEKKEQNDIFHGFITVFTHASL